MKIFLTLCLSLGMGLAMAAKDDRPANRKVSADAQLKGSRADVELTRKIRERLTDDESFSTSAQNITIVTVGNNLTLKGEVEKREEIGRVGAIVNELAGTKQINNQLRVKK